MFHVKVHGKSLDDGGGRSSMDDERGQKRKFLFAPTKLFRTFFLIFFKKISKLFFFFLSTSSAPLYISSPLPFPSPSPAPPFSLPSPSSFQEPSFHFLAHALSRRSSSAFRHRPQHLLPSNTVRPNKTEWRAFVPSCRTKGLCSAMALRSAMFGRTEALSSVLFGRTLPEGKGALRAGEGRCRKAKGAPRESRCRGAGRASRKHVPESGERVLGRERRWERGGRCRKGKGSGAEKGEGNDAEEETGPGRVLLGRKGDGGSVGKGEKMRAASEERGGDRSRGMERKGEG